MMRSNAIRLIFTFVTLTLTIVACTPAASSESAAAGEVQPVATELPTEEPTTEPTAAPTVTPTPEPTELPGEQVYPVSSLDNRNPWLPLDEDNRPMSVYYGFNYDKPPFDNVMVRKAFAASVDREAIVTMALKYQFRDASPATSLTPSETLGRNLYNEVGIPYDPQQAKAYLESAGYTSPDNFPKTKLMVSTRGEAAPGAYYQMATAIVGMWQENLGITVEIEVVGNMGTYIEKLNNDDWSLFQLGWGADYNDPDNFLNALFHSGAEYNFGNFNNDKFDALVDRAAVNQIPKVRQNNYIQAERILCEEEAGIIPLYHSLYYIGN